MQNVNHRMALGDGQVDEDCDYFAERSRHLIAELLHCPSSSISLVSAASIGVGMIMSSLLTSKDEVLVASDEFASTILPVRAAVERAGCKLVVVPFEEIPHHIFQSTTYVVCSHVQSNSAKVRIRFLWRIILSLDLLHER